MRKITYIIGYIAAFAALIATVFKMNHLPLTGPFTAIALLLLSIYFPLFIIDKARDSAEEKTTAAHRVAALSSFFVTFGLLFMIQHWPLAWIMTTDGNVMISSLYSSQVKIFNWENHIIIIPI